MTPRIHLAGRLVVVVDDRRHDDGTLPGAQARTAFALLVCERDRAIDIEELAYNVWPQRRPATWRPALRGVLSRVRTFLVASGLLGSGALQASAGAYRLDLRREIDVDIERAVQATDHATAALAVADLDQARSLASSAREILRLPILPGAHGPWLEQRRRELTRWHLRAAEVVATTATRLGDPDEAITAAEEALTLDPFRESAHQLLMSAHLVAGNRAAALRAYESCRQLLATELGIDPSHDLQDLHATMLASRP